MNSLCKREKASTNMILWCLVSLVLSASTTVDSQLDANGFINIDCGLPANSSFSESTYNLTYVSDEKFTDTGMNRNISSMSSSLYKTLRSFPNDTRNCYTLASLTMMSNYLVRASFLYGNYDNSNNPPIFDIYLGVNYWHTVNMSTAKSDDILSYEIIATATTDYLQVCLVNKGLGTPFISVLELRELKRRMYSHANSSQSLVKVYRWNLGRFFDIVIPLIRYPNNPYDRIWTNYTYSLWKDIYTDNILVPDSDYETPSPVMATAATSSSTSSSLDISWTSNDKSTSFMAILHINDIQGYNKSKSDLREFDIIVNGVLMDNNIVPQRDFSWHVAYSLRFETSYTISLRPTYDATLPPVLNAFELYIVAPVTGVPTYSGDVTAINTIKRNYDLNKGWNGDPCVPTNLSWTGVNCIPDSINNSPRITSLNLSSSGLTGVVIPSFGNLSVLKSLDLSSNNLSGTLPPYLDQLTALTYLDIRGNSEIVTTLPPGLQKQRNDKKLTYLFGDINFRPPPSSSKKSLLVTIVIAGTTGLLLIAVSILTVLFFKRRKYRGYLKGKQEILDFVHLEQENDKNSSKSTPSVPTADGRHIHIENIQFSYSELKMITNNFQNKIGTGGFGSVYVGLLENRIQVAVKMRSLTSSQGVKEFLAEAQNLTRVHHKNLMSLLGYCMDRDCMALVYEYMPEGTLENKLKDNERPLTWKQRVCIAYESALGLEYLHKACNPPLIHRDVKTGNILLNAKLEAKIADFRLSRAFNSNGNSHVSTAVVGTPGYLDPEYSSSYQLCEKSDVFSFGVVLLEVITGQPPIIAGPEGGHVIRWVSQKLSKGDIRSIVDPIMNEHYDINSIWKVTDLARKCTELASSERPNMNTVVIELKESLDLENSTEGMRNESTTSTYTNQHSYLRNDNFISDISQTTFEMAYIGGMPTLGPTVK